MTQTSTHHKPLGVLLYMFVCGNWNGHSLLVAVVVVGLDFLSSFQPIGLLSWDRQHSQNQLFLPCTDQIHHLLMGGTFHTDPITGGKIKWRERQKESQRGVLNINYCHRFTHNHFIMQHDKWSTHRREQTKHLTLTREGPDCTYIRLLWCQISVAYFSAKILQIDFRFNNKTLFQLFIPILQLSLSHSIKHQAFGCQNRKYCCHLFVTLYSEWLRYYALIRQLNSENVTLKNVWRLHYSWTVKLFAVYVLSNTL